IGDDAFGETALAALRERGVDVTGVEPAAGEATGVSVILSTPGDRAILTAPGAIPTLSSERVASWLDAWEGEPGVLHVASYFLQPRLAAGLETVLAAARSRGWVTSLDTNWDPREEWRGVDDLLEHLDVLLPNASELRALGAAMGVRGDDEQLAHAIARRGPRVVVKDGARGGWSVAAGGERASAPGLVLDVVDTTGAGDSFDAGYLAALAAGVTDEAERLRWAAVAGSLSTRGPGGTARQATRAELDAAMAS
ncbi:MAG: carbohydrate kinase family protein, partial [Microbacterium sp.]